jgi:hypothetical protein
MGVARLSEQIHLVVRLHLVVALSLVWQARVSRWQPGARAALA